MRPPLPASAVIAGLGLVRPYAFSGDVHQETWDVALWTMDIDDRWGPKIAVHSPHLGDWAVEPQLSRRPRGELPKVTAGAAPAYELSMPEALADLTVVAFRIELWSDWQQSDRFDFPDTATAPTAAPSRRLILDWVERHKGLGAPRQAEVELPDMRAFVFWNIPWSGRNETDYWIYCLQDSGWLLLKSATFQPDHDQAHSATFDATAHRVRFLDADGAELHHAPIAGCRWDE